MLGIILQFICGADQSQILMHYTEDMKAIKSGKYNPIENKIFRPMKAH